MPKGLINKYFVMVSTYDYFDGRITVIPGLNRLSNFPCGDAIHRVWPGNAFAFKKSKPD